MEHRIIVVGIGPGSPDYLLPIAKQTIEKAHVIVGSKRALDSFAPAGAEKKIIDGDIPGVIAFIRTKLKEDSVVAMVSGDPGFYSLLAALRNEFSAEELHVIPGISSVQLAFARIGQLWQDATLVSLHGRSVSNHVLQYAKGNKLGILTDNNHHPEYIAKLLLSLNWPSETTVWLCANLSYDNEYIESTTLGSLQGCNSLAHCIMVVVA